MYKLSSLAVVERRQIYRAVRLTKGNLSEAARILEIDRRTLYRKLQKYAKERRAPFITIDYVSAYPASLAGGTGSTAIGLLAKSYANELTADDYQGRAGGSNRDGND